MQSTFRSKFHQNINSCYITLFCFTGQEDTYSLAGANQGGSDNTAHLKGKLNSLMDLARSLHE
jgi:hypothetical protein